MKTLRDRLEAERTIDLERYNEDGFHSRSEYLASLCQENGLSLEQGEMLIDLLGPEEDFDGLVNGLEDHAETMAGF